nr:topoisomerase IV [Alteromonas macleodii]|tara:strand:- start:13516 stop:14685 length:1170 start_codon:yes stop_codon:yes gene_type:complete
MKYTKALLTLAVAASFSASSLAEIRINGFGNFNAGITSTEDSFLGYDDTVDFSNQSLFALQVSGDIGEKFSATAQVLARGNEDYSPEFEWAYLNYEINDNWSAQAGRLRLPLFSYSDSLDVAYSYHWVTAPSTVYNVPFNNIDGLKIVNTTSFNNWDLNTSLSVGQYKGTSFGADIIGQNAVLLSAQLSNMEWTFRGVVGRATTTLDLTKSDLEDGQFLGNGFNAIEAAGFTELADNLRVDEDSGEFYGMSFMYDNMEYFFGGEATSIRLTNTFANDDDAFYVTAGARFNKWTPSITYERFESNGDVKFADQIAAISASALPIETAQGLSAIAIGAQMAQLEDYDVVTATLRYDLDAGIALKGDVSKVSHENNDALDATLLRLGVNFVF